MNAVLRIMLPVLAAIVALVLTPAIRLRRAVRRVNWLAVSADLVMLACAALLLFACWIAAATIFVIGD